MSDHVSGPRAIADPVADITDVYAFPCPDGPQHLVLIMNVFPFAGPLALFSDAIIYRIRLRSVAAPSTDRPRIFEVGDVELTFEFTFGIPANLEGNAPPAQFGQCVTPKGEIISFRVSCQGYLTLLLVNLTVVLWSLPRHIEPTGTDLLMVDLTELVGRNPDSSDDESDTVPANSDS